jgi:hypothetical protein
MANKTGGLEIDEKILGGHRGGINPAEGKTLDY